MQQLSKEMGEQINIHCNNISMPGHDLETESHTMFGPHSSMVGDTVAVACGYTDDWNNGEEYYIIFYDPWASKC